MEIRRLSPHFGAELTDLDVSQDLSPEARAQLRDLLDEHQLLLVRGQEDIKSQMSLLEVFGRLFDEFGDGRYSTTISNVDAQSVFVDTRLLFHQDYGFTAWTVPVLSLYAAELTGGSVNTIFASNVQGYATLSDEERSRMVGLKVMLAYELPEVGRLAQKADELPRFRIPDGASEDRFARIIEPLLKAHPKTGLPMLYVTEQNGSHILGMQRDEGEAIIQAAFGALYLPENLYEHVWQLNDLVIWDNIALQHARGLVGPDKRRTLRRVCVSDKSADEIFSSADGSEVGTPISV